MHRFVRYDSLVIMALFKGKKKKSRTPFCGPADETHKCIYVQRYLTAVYRFEETYVLLPTVLCLFFEESCTRHEKATCVVQSRCGSNVLLCLRSGYLWQQQLKLPAS